MNYILKDVTLVDWYEIILQHHPGACFESIETDDKYDMVVAKPADIPIEDCRFIGVFLLNTEMYLCSGEGAQQISLLGKAWYSFPICDSST